MEPDETRERSLTSELSDGVAYRVFAKLQLTDEQS